MKSKKRDIGVTALVLMALISVGFFGCNLESGIGEGSLVLNFESASRGIEWTPALDMTIATYTITGKGPVAADSFTVSGFEGGIFTCDPLSVGTWWLTVGGVNAGGVQIAEVQITVVIRKSQQTSATATLRPIGGVGNLDMAVSWTDSASNLEYPEVTVVIRDESGETVVAGPTALTLGTDSLSASGTIADLPNGWYEVLVGLYEKIPSDEPEVVWEGIFVLRIVAGETTSGTVVIPESQIRFGTGAISLTIGEDLDNPLAVAFTGPPEDETVMDGDTVTFTSTGTYSDSAEYRWYVNGSLVSSGNAFTHQFTASGEYTVSLLVLDGDVLGGFGKSVTITPYAIGDMGRGGGLVFYVDGSDEFSWNYLEAAPSDVMLGASDYTHTFGYYRTTVNDEPTMVGTATGIGTGKVNTEALVGTMGETTYISFDPFITTTTGDYAARLCDIHVSGGYDDWFLPSKDELDLMHDNLEVQGLGGFSDNFYWSSSEDLGGHGAWNQDFSNGYQYSTTRYFTYRVRPVRAF